jgi:PhoPQ-activated pathogenicity-related protein
MVELAHRDDFFPHRILRSLFFVLPVVGFLVLVSAVTGRETELDRYVMKPDPSYEWSLVRTVSVADAKVHLLRMTSQTWRTPEEFVPSVWTHWLTVVVPEEVRAETALLFIGGGSNDRGEPNDPPREMITAAKACKMVCAELGMVPNQPSIFPEEGQKRWEDAIIAVTWDKFLRTGDPTWPLRLPMTKAAVRAMDTITAFCGTEEGGKHDVGTFYVAGGSKRGWTTWTTAAVDKRVIGFSPIVIDMLNLVPSFIHHWRAYGFWAPAINDYVEMRIMDWLGTPEFDALLKLVDPYSYRDRYNQPKFLINASGDQFFLPDSSQFYWDDLPGEKYLRYVPNAGHGLDDTDALESLIAFMYSVVYDKPRPRFAWGRGDDGALVVEAEDLPDEVRLWYATNPNARDFRVDILGKVWTSVILTPEGGSNRFVGNVPMPEKGWTAYFVELMYKDRAPAPMKFTTGVRVKPDVLPYEYQKPDGPPPPFFPVGQN